MPHRPPTPALVLAGLLAGWVPVALALEASAALPRLLSYGWRSVLLLAVRALLAGLALVAGRALWRGDLAARRLAQTWLVLDVLISGYQAELSKRDFCKPNLSPLQEQLYESVKSMCEGGWGGKLSI